MLYMIVVVGGCAGWVLCIGREKGGSNDVRCGNENGRKERERCESSITMTERKRGRKERQDERKQDPLSTYCIWRQTNWRDRNNISQLVWGRGG